MISSEHVDEYCCPQCSSYSKVVLILLMLARGARAYPACCLPLSTFVKEKQINGLMWVTCEQNAELDAMRCGVGALDKEAPFIKKREQGQGRRTEEVKI